MTLFFGRILLRYQHLHHRINCRQRFAPRQVVVVAENGEHKTTAPLRLSVAGKRIHVAQRSGLGVHQATRRSIEKTVGQ